MSARRELLEILERHMIRIEGDINHRHADLIKGIKNQAVYNYLSKKGQLDSYLNLKDQFRHTDSAYAAFMFSLTGTRHRISDTDLFYHSILHHMWDEILPEYLSLLRYGCEDMQTLAYIIDIRHKLHERIYMEPSIKEVRQLYTKIMCRLYPSYPEIPTS